MKNVVRLTFFVVLFARPAFAQIDVTGNWAAIFNEDQWYHAIVMSDEKKAEVPQTEKPVASEPPNQV